MKARLAGKEEHQSSVSPFRVTVKNPKQLDVRDEDDFQQENVATSSPEATKPLFSAIYSIKHIYITQSDEPEKEVSQVTRKLTKPSDCPSDNEQPISPLGGAAAALVASHAIFIPSSPFLGLPENNALYFCMQSQLLGRNPCDKHAQPTFW
ncbi:hypothetical protein RUM44_000689 [Polyplax serrata]|uniref:Uncharacterized protein n=1 Tax=Polyplax serrata TaxID=468196 RepID=A0ABR1B624_POLSC